MEDAVIVSWPAARQSEPDTGQCSVVREVTEVTSIQSSLSTCHTPATTGHPPRPPGTPEPDRGRPRPAAASWQRVTTRGRCHAQGRGQSSIVTAPRPLRVFPDEDMVSRTTGAPVWSSELPRPVGGLGGSIPGQYLPEYCRDTLLSLVEPYHAVAMVYYAFSCVFMSEESCRQQHHDPLSESRTTLITFKGNFL